MKTTIRLGFLISALGAASGLLAQECSAAASAGKYVVVCDGYLSPAPNAPLIPAKSLGVVTGSEEGVYTGSGTISLGTGAVVQAVTGTATVNSDCTGKITYNQTIGGQPAPPLNIMFIVSDNSNRIDGLAVDPGAVFSCRLTRSPARSLPNEASRNAQTPSRAAGKDKDTQENARVAAANNNNGGN